ncbi:DUF603 domain-containing protein (plasmid) [Borrelia parkeri]|nr:DUF603 domain-containing protein [Borrelia parkeri]
MSRIKKSLDDYVVYFREGKLNDASIAKELGVSRVNVGKMRRKWEEIKDDQQYENENSKITIREDTFNNMLARSFETESEANRLKNQVEIEKNKIALRFLNSFNKYFQLELQEDLSRAVALHEEIENQKEKIRNSDSNNYASLNEELVLKITKLNELETSIASKEMTLCYKPLLKLKSVLDLSKGRE